jgi:hypothetical protein
MAPLMRMAGKLRQGPRSVYFRCMVCDMRWKCVHRDLGADPAHPDDRARMEAALTPWGLRLSLRTTLSEQQVRAMSGVSQRRGILIGVWDESDIPDDLWQGYRGERH